jgi:UDP-glucose 4-epimerase
MRSNSVFSLFVDRAVHNQPITIEGSGAQARQFTHASDIASAFALAVESTGRGERFNIVADTSYTIRELADAVVGRLPTEITYGQARMGDVASSRVTNRRARERLGWQPTISLEDGLDELIAWQLGDGARTSQPAA